MIAAAQHIEPMRDVAPRRALRVALFSGNYNCVADGANQALNKLVAYLENEQGADVRVYSPTISRPAFEPAGTLVSVPSFAIPGRSEYRLAFGLPSKIRDDLERFAPDLVHVSAPDFLGVAAQKWAREKGIPVIASLHTRFETYFDYYGLGMFRGWAERHLARFYDRSDYVLVPNSAIQQEMTAHRDDGHIRIWGRGVDRARFDPARRDMAWRRASHIADDEMAVMFFGRLVLEKGVDDFVAVVRGLRDAGLKVRPLIVGEGPAHERFATALPDAVFTGHLAGDELGRAVASADVMVNPSTTEAFGNVVLEAMAAGRPVVSADAPSARALIEPGATGLLCPPGNIDAYVAAVRRLVEAPQERRRLSRAARAASATFTWSVALSAVASVYAEAVGQGA